MSGGGGIQKAFGVAMAGLSVGAAPFTGGLSLAALPGSVAIAQQGNVQAKKEQRKLTQSMEQPKIKTKVMPVIDSAEVEKKRLESLNDLQRRTGRVSTLLTNQTPQNTTFG